MGRRVVVASNCQTGALYAALSAMLPDDSVEQIAWLGAEPPRLRDMLRVADVWVCSVPRELARSVLDAAGSQARLIVVPAVWFTGFHPDQTPIPLRAGGELEGAVGPYHSKIVMWSFAHGLGAARTIEQFTPQTFAALGYLESWTPAVETLRSIFAVTDIDFAQWLLPLHRRGAFMLTNNHPRVDALIQMSRLVAAQLGADPDVLAYDWESIVPDGLLATSMVWPVYPGIADSLDLHGAYLWRLGNGEIIGLEQFVHRSFDSYSTLDPATIDIAHIDLDPRFATTLGGVEAGSSNGGRRP